MEREAFLARLTTAVAEAHVPEADTYQPGPLVTEFAGDDVVARFARRLVEVDGEFHPVADDRAAREEVGAIMKRYDALTFVAWDDLYLPCEGLTEFVGTGRSRLDTRIDSDAAQRRRHQADYLELDVGITGASAGLAESGSIVLMSGKGRPRMVSLIPLVHIVLLARSTIVPSLSHWVAANSDAARETSNLVVITGPSRTADIEQELNLGVHGPKHLHVVCLPG